MFRVSGAAGGSGEGFSVVRHEERPPRVEKRKGSVYSRGFGQSDPKRGRPATMIGAITPEQVISSLRFSGCIFQIFIFAKGDPGVAVAGKTPAKVNTVEFRSHEGQNHPRIKILSSPKHLDEGESLDEDDWCKPGDEPWSWVKNLAGFILHSYALKTRVNDDCSRLPMRGHDAGHNRYAVKQARYALSFYNTLNTDHILYLDPDFEERAALYFGDIFKITDIYTKLTALVGVRPEDITLDQKEEIKLAHSSLREAGAAYLAKQAQRAEAIEKARVEAEERARLERARAEAEEVAASSGWVLRLTVTTQRDAEDDDDGEALTPATRQALNIKKTLFV